MEFEIRNDFDFVVYRVTCPLPLAVKHTLVGRCQVKRLTLPGWLLSFFELGLFERLFVAAAATVYQQSHFWTRLRSEGQELFLHFCSDPNFTFESTAMHDLCNATQEIQSLKFMGRSDLTHAHSNCMPYI